MVFLVCGSITCAHWCVNITNDSPLHDEVLYYIVIIHYFKLGQLPYNNAQNSFFRVTLWPCIDGTNFLMQQKEQINPQHYHTVCSQQTKHGPVIPFNIAGPLAIPITPLFGWLFLSHMFSPYAAPDSITVRISPLCFAATGYRAFFSPFGQVYSQTVADTEWHFHREELCKWQSVTWP